MMNIKQTTGPTSDFSVYKFPQAMPTEEWGGGELRTYDNYRRPVSNLFENDREIANNYKAVLETLFSTDGVINGCGISEGVSEHAAYAYVNPGNFIYNGKAYSIYPKCEAAAKQFEQMAQGKHVHIEYDGTYFYAKITDPVGVSAIVNNNANAIEFCFAVADELQLPDYNVTDSLLLPIVAQISGGVIVITDGAKIAAKSIAGPNDITLGEEMIRAKLNGSLVESDTVDPDSISNRFVKIGSTSIGLGDSVGVGSLSGVETINEISIKKTDNTNQIEISYGEGDTLSSYIKADGQFDLKDAATKEVATGFGSSDDTKLPTVKVIKNGLGITNQGTDFFTTTKSLIVKSLNATGNGDVGGKVSAKNVDVTDNIKVDGVGTIGKIKITDNTNASRSGAILSENASIYTNGGIEAKGDIFSNGSIIGVNTGTYSLREYKENITDFDESALDVLNTVKIVNYNYKSDPTKLHKIGFIADDTHEYLSTPKKNIMDMSNCVALLIKAVQELSEENKKLKEMLNGN